MNKNATMLIILALGLIMGMAASSMFNINIPFNVPTGHASVAGSVTVHDNTMDSSYPAVFVRSGESPSLQIVPLSFVGNVKYSLWEFRALPNDASSVYATMLVWGPGDAGEYFVEVGRLSTNSFTVSYQGNTVNWQQSGNDGFVYFQTTP